MFYKKNTVAMTSHTILLTRNTVDETMQQQHLNQYINIYLHRECHKINFIRYFIVTAENLIESVIFYFSVHGDRQENNIYLQRCSQDVKPCSSSFLKKELLKMNYSNKIFMFPTMFPIVRYMLNYYLVKLLRGSSNVLI